MWRIDREHLERAAEAVRARLGPTRVQAALGVILKHEHEQITGSFKVRGAIAALDALDPELRAQGVITSSAGNHGAGLAYAGAIFGAPVTVFVGARTPMAKRAAIAGAGAHLEVIDALSYDDVEVRAKEAARDRGLTFVSPFDDPWVAAGNGGTLGLEILDAVPDVATIVAPVGGGGLIAGLAAAIEGSSARLVGVQSEACPAMVESFARGHALTRFVGEDTLAEGLEGGVSETTYAIARRALDRMDAVSEEAIADAMRTAHEALGIVIEGSAAVALAWARAHPEASAPCVVVLTGRNVDRDVFDRAIKAAG